MRRGLIAALCAGALTALATAVAVAQDNAEGIDVSATAGTQFTSPVASFTYSTPLGPDSFSATIDWGDGTPEDTGTIAIVGCPFPDQTCFEVRGTHVYAAPGTYEIQTTILGPDATPVPVSSNAVVKPKSTATAALLGPSEVRLGEPARFIADVTPNAVRHRWDLDGDGTYERDTGKTPAVDHGFPHGGKFTVRMRATLGSGETVTAARAVVVDRPPVVGLETTPVNPEPGEKVKLQLHSKTEVDTSFKLFSWDVGGVKPKDTTVKLPPIGGGPKQEVKLKGAQPTVKPKLKLALPKKKGLYPITVTAMDGSGGTVKVESGIKVGSGKLPKPGPPAKVANCDDKSQAHTWPQWRCADIAVYPSQPATAPVKTLFENATPDAEACLPTNIHPKKANQLGKLGDALDLPYPAPEGFGINQQVGAGAIAARGAGGAHASGQVEEECEQASSRTVSWDFGDGTKLNAPPGGLPDIVSHPYAKPGTYAVTLLAEVPYVANGGTPGAGAKSPLKFFHFEYFLAKRTMTVEVLPSHCGTLKLNGIPASSVPDEGEADKLGAKGCFARRTLGGTTLYQPLEGYDLDLNTLRVEVTPPPHEDPGTPLVNQSKAQVFAPAGTVYSRYPTSESLVVKDRPAIAGTGLLTIPKQAPDPELGQAVSHLPPISADQKPFAGLPVKGTQAALSPTRGAYVKVFVEPPPPIGGGTPPVVLGGGPKTLLKGGVIPLAAGPNEKTDFQLVLSGYDLGLFEITDGKLGRSTSGNGWFGGMTLRIPALDATFQAPYKPPPSSTSGDCETIDGPSGVSLANDGSFEFGGFQGEFGAPIVIGPVGLDCVAVTGQSSPFVMVGKVGGKVPPGGAFTVDGCFLMTVLDKGQQAAGCNASLTAKDDLTWFRSRGTIGIFDALNLGSGYFDLRAGGATLAASVGGGFHRNIGPFYADGSVKGDLTFKPQFGFYLGGGVEICKSIDLAPDPCAGVNAAVSTKGFGACAWFGGFVYYWKGGPDLFFLSCDLEGKLGVTRASASGAQSRSVKIRKGLREVGFEIRGEGGEPPIVTATGPRRTQIVDDGGPVQRTPGHHIVRDDRDGTILVVQRPKGGTWRFDAQPGSPGISDVIVHEPLREPRVEGRIKGKGRHRTLRYRAKLAGTDRLVFVESGSTLTRQLGKGGSGEGRIRFATGNGSPGKRTITAYVERRGILYKQIRVGSYRAPKSRRLQRPKPLRAKIKQGKLRAKWARVRGARSYEMVVRFRDGRVSPVRTKRTKATLPGIDASSGKVRVSVVALGARGQQSGPARDRAKAKRAKRARIRL